MTRKFRITLEGKEFLVEMEELVESPPTQEHKTPCATENVKTATTPATHDTLTITSPIAGVVVSCLVSVGDMVKEGMPVCTVEAMKMQTQIMSPYEGVVAQIHVHDNQAITQDACIMTLQ